MLFVDPPKDLPRQIKSLNASMLISNLLILNLDKCE